MPGPCRLFLLATAISGAALLGACSQPEKGAAAERPPPQVSVAQVLVRPVNDWAEYHGRLQAPESVELRPRVSGMIDRVHFRDGARVAKGQLLFQIDARPYQAEVERLQAQLQQARAQEQRAYSESMRAERLRASNAISIELANARQTTLLEARSSISAAQARLEVARLNLAHTRITAPIGGQISRAEVTAGNLVTAGATRLSTLVGTDRLHAYFDIDEGTYMNRIGPLALTGAGGGQGPQPARLLLVNRPGIAVTGELDFLDNQINPRTGTMRARVTVDNANGDLTPGLWTRIQLPAGPVYPASLVRDEAIGTDLGRRYVLVLEDDGRVRYRLVKLGPRLAGLRVVREGLREGERIVVNGLQRTRPDDRVMAQPVAMADEQTLANLAQWSTHATSAPAATGKTAASATAAAPRG
ncbi:efflux RND transporter periplasmic adaptor subunit [Delftia deserti]|uniref:Efflux RND transporter periplasmic adaptor subunit n=1 Tax=Delftia deserti TaxID=1651218 RepID=A0ABW5EK24_9BURK